MSNLFPDDFSSTFQFLAALYETETKVVNQALTRNINRFPGDFMFQLTNAEYDGLRFQIEPLENVDSLRSQIVTSIGRGGIRYLPYAFTEQGVAMSRTNQWDNQGKKMRRSRISRHLRTKDVDQTGNFSNHFMADLKSLVGLTY